MIIFPFEKRLSAVVGGGGDVYGACVDGSLLNIHDCALAA